MNNIDMPDAFLSRVSNAKTSTGRRLGQAPNRLNGMGDYPEEFIDEVRPATSAPQPPGPADFPITNPNTDPTTNELLARILNELIRQNTATRAVIRASNVDSVGQTLDWSMVGMMDRLIIRNKGTSSVWFSFDRNGPAVNSFTSNESWELQANESVNITLSLYQKVGLRCATGQTGTVHAMGWQSVAGNQAGAIS